MLAEGHGRQIAPGSGLARSRGTGPRGTGPEDPARSRYSSRVGLLGGERLPTTEPSSAAPAASALTTHLSREVQKVPGQTSLTTQHYSYT